MAILLLSAGSVHGAAPNFCYTIRGTGAGSVNGVPFSNSEVVVRLYANTADVGPLIGPPGFTVTGSSATMSIAGVGTANFTGSKRFFVAQSAFAAGLGIAPNGSDQLDVQHPDLAGYDLRSGFGPVNILLPAVLSLSNEPTTLGILTLSSLTGLRFDASMILPKLDCSLSGTNLVLSWPTNAPGYVLVSNASPASVVGWSVVPNEAVVEETNFVVRMPAVGTPRVFRLRD